MVRSIFAIGCAAVLAGCASSGQLRGDGLARLERSRASRPNDAAVARSLGIAYYKAGRYADARPHLEHAARTDPRDGSAALYLGLTAEQLNDLPAARAAYQSYIRYGRTSRVRRQLEARLAAINRLELQLYAKNAIAQESQIGAQTPSPRAVAVMPLRFVGTDSTLQPLERGLAELITTDLSRSTQLVVVERARIQALLDEIALQQAGRTDATTNVRAGRMIQAGRIVSGQIVQTEERLRVDAAIVNTQTSAVAGGAVNENTLEQLFEIEKAIVLQLFDSLGVRLTTAERDAIERRPTRSLQAFLAYSRGLSLEDQGKYEEASRSFQEAVRIDPGFGQAQQKSAETQAVAQGMQLSATSIESNLQGTQEGQVAQKAQQGQTAPSSSSGGSGGGASNTANTINSSSSGGATDAAGAGGGATGQTASTSTTSTSTQSSASTPPPKDPVSSASGGETKTQTATVVIVVKLPKP